ncbi:MAG: hypothetical protein KBE09_03350 [Candidatus Pacebacteria bacterium]|nr:hypothetical protein [Candidatus Paceibacterota bacterium]
MTPASYNNKLADAREQEKARATMSYFVVTATLGILGYYVHIRSGFAADPSRVGLANYLFPCSLLLLFIVSVVSKWRYAEECELLVDASTDEDEAHVKNGHARNKLQRYRNVPWYMPSRVDAACGGAGLAVVATMIMHYWHF